MRTRTVNMLGALVAGALLLPAATARGQTAADQYTPKVGQPGKDAVWVPTSPALVEKMLDLAKVTATDFVMDLGSGDGRNVIAAGKRGARGRGVEYNADLVALSNRTAKAQGVGDKVEFVQGDMYEADISDATVLALFLLTENLDRLAPKFLAMKPGSRIVANTFGISGWTPDETEKLETDCTNWCTALLWIVPAKVGGVWKMPQGELKLQQEFQMVTGALSAGGASQSIAGGRLRGDHITFTLDGAQYEGRVSGNTMEGTVTRGGQKSAWKATRS
ncbi:MAG TPA: class I SAM-dependent methyltransferase [Vicinamibacterales bacterium]|nr:class I SAM-dependent methyltransferase [Vicinamibacterales bacterium]